MFADTSFPHPGAAVRIIASALATLITVALLAAVTGLFQSRGQPLEHFVATGRAYASQPDASEHAACSREWVGALPGTRVAVQ